MPEPSAENPLSKPVNIMLASAIRHCLFQSLVLAGAIAMLSGCSLFFRDYQCCYRKYDDQQIDKILVDKLHISKPHRNDVQWKHCQYIVIIWPVPNVVDGQTLVELDQDGNIIRGPI